MEQDEKLRQEEEEFKKSQKMASLSSFLSPLINQREQERKVFENLIDL